MTLVCQIMMNSFHGCMTKSKPHFTDTPLLRPCQGGSHFACLNFKMSWVGVNKCLSLIVGFDVTVAIWQREVVSCRDFILRTVATFWSMSLVGIYPGSASLLPTVFFVPGESLYIFFRFNLLNTETINADNGQLAIWQREVVSCRDFILHAVAPFWAISLVGIYPGRASLMT